LSYLYQQSMELIGKALEKYNQR